MVDDSARPPDALPDPVISVRDLRKSYGSTHAVEGLSLEVARGEIFGLLGPNGAGKTTTVECLQGLRHPDSGDVRLLGLDPKRDMLAIKQRIGSQLQESALPERIRVWEALDLFASSVPGASDWETLLEDWGLAEKRNASFGSLSGGQRQRLLVALALVNSPEIVFLDEMTTGMDPAARRVAWELIEHMRARGTTVVLVTHFMDEAESLCDRIAIVVAGRIRAIGTPAELRSAHGGPARVRFTASLLDADFLKRVEGVTGVEVAGNSYEVTGAGAILARVAAALVERGHEPEDLEVARPTLDEVYLRLTGDAGSSNDQDGAAS